MYLTPETFFSLYPIGYEIGRGEYGRVYNTHSPDQYAIKKFAEFGPDFFNELNIHSKVICPNILRPLAWTCFVNTDSSQKNPYMVYPKAIPIHQINISREKLHKDLLNAVSFLLKHGIAHRDIKPDNVMYYKGNVVLIDLGLASEAVWSDNSWVMSGPAYAQPFRHPQYNFNGPNSIEMELYALGKVLHTVIPNLEPNPIGLILYPDPNLNNLLYNRLTDWIREYCRENTLPEAVCNDAITLYQRIIGIVSNEKYIAAILYLAISIHHSCSYSIQQVTEGMNISNGIEEEIINILIFVKGFIRYSHPKTL